MVRNAGKKAKARKTMQKRVQKTIQGWKMMQNAGNEAKVRKTVQNTENRAKERRKTKNKG